MLTYLFFARLLFFQSLLLQACSCIPWLMPRRISCLPSAFNARTNKDNETDINKANQNKHKIILSAHRFRNSRYLSRVFCVVPYMMVMAGKLNLTHCKYLLPHFTTGPCTKSQYQQICGTLPIVVPYKGVPYIGPPIVQS